MPAPALSFGSVKQYELEDRLPPSRQPFLGSSGERNCKAAAIRDVRVSGALRSCVHPTKGEERGARGGKRGNRTRRRRSH